MRKHAVFLSGPVGVGKTTLGIALAERLSGRFIDGDDLSDPTRPWYCSSLRTSRTIVQAGLAALETASVAVIAYPLRRTNWICFRRRFGDAGVSPVFVSLRAAFPTIVDERRGRKFSGEERDRICAMIAEGYGARPFSDLVIDTDVADFTATLARLETEIRHVMAV